MNINLLRYAASVLLVAGTIGGIIVFDNHQLNKGSGFTVSDQQAGVAGSAGYGDDALLIDGEEPSASQTQAHTKPSSSQTKPTEAQATEPPVTESTTESTFSESTSQSTSTSSKKVDTPTQKTAGATAKPTAAKPTAAATSAKATVAATTAANVKTTSSAAVTTKAADTQNTTAALKSTTAQNTTAAQKTSAPQKTATPTQASAESTAAAPADTESSRTSTHPSKATKSAATGQTEATTAQTTTAQPTTKATTKPTTTTTTQAKLSTSDAAAQMFSKINNYRSSNGKGNLTRVTSGPLYDAAKKRLSEIMSSYSHTRPDGRSSSTAITDQGISPNCCGENLAKSSGATVDDVFNKWISSSGHKANILNGSYTSSALVCGYSGNTLYWVELFMG